jgi:hypothetical protein
MTTAQHAALAPPPPATDEYVSPYTAPHWGLPPADFQLLMDMLSYRRPAGSNAERKFINRFLRPLGPTEDDAGNLYVTVGDNPRVLWSCHTDTVHRSQGRQRVFVDDEGFARVEQGQREANCLGADCTTGVWLMVKMIEAGKPGLYVFHRAEEVGCIGSGWIAKNNADVLKGIDYAIAFDRYGYNHVITHQASGRCCSDDFAFALANSLGGEYRPDDGGVYTDTNEYIGIIPECTNISVGYFDQHTSRECQSLEFLADLLPAMLALDVDALPVKRDPSVVEPWGYGSYGGYGGYGRNGKSNRHSDPAYGYEEYDPDDAYVPGNVTLAAMCRYYPDEVADILRAYGISEDDVAAEIYNTTGQFPY